ncbi:hypothetical protein MTR_1g012330 [Medicago truncatula]|uniref:KIB1-4 beta-propeller domain-containing protein n=1 Tax=Medicago truncatula TaxID=3880 RepID=G7I6Y7_MEDTR|nr:hypothetical protein MTR_1g012330 [Medicago truncatula]
MIECFLRSIYVTSSGGYFIMVGYNNSFLLSNPFTRIKKIINVSTFEVKSNIFANHVLLAFGKCSDEFVLVVLCKSSRSLCVYQSQNCDWVTYSTMGNPGRVVDFMVSHNIIYVVTDKANIGGTQLEFWDDKKLQKCSTLPAPPYGTDSHMLDWCFRHLQYEFTELQLSLESENLISELVKFLDSSSVAALSDPYNEHKEVSAVEALSEIHRYISPSLDQASLPFQSCFIGYLDTFSKLLTIFPLNCQRLFQSDEE